MLVERADLHGRIAVREFAGMDCSTTAPRYLGQALALADLPRRETRRLTAFEKHVLACLLGLGEEAREAPIVFASRYGTMSSNTLALLKDLLSGTPLSPTGFSLSVHNAAVGVASQLMNDTAPYTAIAAGERTLDCALLECLALLGDGAERVILAFGEARMEQESEAFDEGHADLYFACLLSRAEASGAPALTALVAPDETASPRGLLARLEAHFTGAPS